MQGRRAEYAHHFEAETDVPASPEELFSNIDNHERLAEHMTRSSMMMAGSRMAFAYDGDKGQALGSKIAMTGSVLGIRLALEEVVIERDPPLRKTWETVGEPRLLVIGAYRMGFEIATAAQGSRLKVFIDWDDPAPPWRWLGPLLGRAYAKWCVRSMTQGVAYFFRSRRREHARAAT